MKEDISRTGCRKDSPQSWLVCFACFILRICTLGFQFSFGVIFSELLEDFQESKAKTAWVGSLTTALSCLMAPVSMSLARRFGEWRIMLTGASMVVSSLLLSSRASGVDQLIISFGILNGIGCSCLYPFLDTILSRVFKKRLSLALGLSSSGSSVGPLILSPLLNISNQALGWRTTFQILAAIFAALFLFSIFCCFRANDDDDHSSSSSLKKPQLNAYVEVLKNPSFVIFCLATSIICLEYVVSHTHQVQFAIEFGVAKAKAVLLPTYMAVGNAIGRVLFGYFFDLHLLDTIYVFQIVIFATALTSFLGSLARTYAHLVTYFFLLMMFDGGFQGQMFFAMTSVVGCNKSYVGWQLVLLMQAVSISSGPPLVGMIVDKTQDYSAIFYMVGIPLTAGGLMLFILRCLKTNPVYISTINQGCSGNLCNKTKETRIVTELADKDCLVYKVSVV